MALLKIILKRKLTLICCSLSFNVLAVSNFNDTVFKRLISKTINYIELNQVKVQNGNECFAGEWPTFIQNLEKIPYLGYKGKSAYDSNIFNTLYVHNGLAEYYLNFEQNERIISILKRAQSGFHRYIKDSTFNFWPELPRATHVKCPDHECTQRRANNFYYHYKFINDYANIYNDADDTSAGLLAYYFSNKVKDRTGTDSLAYYNLYKLSPFVERYRDTGERKTNWYNKKIGLKGRTGAYMTWFGPDRPKSNVFNWFKPLHPQQNILYGTNEVDCIVNANILRTMYVLGDTMAEGIPQAKKLIREAVNKKICHTCGVYYPTEFSFHYAVGKAISSGVSGLNDVRESLIKDILSRMNINGYWPSFTSTNHVQSTLFAINALLLLQQNNQYMPEIEKGLNYIIRSKIEEGNIVYWQAGIFFSGGSAVRYEHVWRSESYTSILALEAFTNYLRSKA